MHLAYIYTIDGIQNGTRVGPELIACLRFFESRSYPRPAYTGLLLETRDQMNCVELRTIFESIDS